MGGGKKSPRSTVDALLRHQIVNNTIRKRLLLQESIIEEIRNKYKNTKKERERNYCKNNNRKNHKEIQATEGCTDDSGLFKKAWSNTRWRAHDF